MSPARTTTDTLQIALRDVQKKFSVSSYHIRRIVQEILRAERVKRTGEITVCLLDDRSIRLLHKRFLRENTPTDVITFNLGAGSKRENLVADIAISTDTALRNAKLFGTSPRYEVFLYLAHGMLHLLGYTDNTISRRKLMERKAMCILARLGITR